MSATPMQVLTRPFAVEPVTHIMLPDGIFDNALYNLQIACHYTNVSTAPLNNVSISRPRTAQPSTETFCFPMPWSIIQRMN